MGGPTRRATLSRQQRLARVEAARHELTEFLAALEPLWRRSLVDPESLTPEDVLDVMRRRTFPTPLSRMNQRSSG